uniref:Chromosome 9 open reading frame 152 n=1 Tax=Chelonoidis abingdonii TaxID=106734 RepID=A0A8C0GCJ8_CHEAB
MKDISCFCLTLSSLWKQMVQAYKCICGIFLVTHTPEQQASDCDTQPTKMDVNLLEEQYDCIKQKQKLQTHIIVFKTDENQSVPGESMVNAVLINKKTRKQKEFKEHIPVRKVALELTSNGNVQDSSPWRTHLGIHRLLQADCQKTPCDLAHCKNEQISFDNERLTMKENVMLPYEKTLTASEQSTVSLNELGNSSMLNSPTEENSNSISGTCQQNPLKSVSPAIWTHQQISSTKCISISRKLSYYPFPQKKTPRISEAARRLGLYVSP